MAASVILKRGDITVEEVDAIVNAANSTLLGGGGVDGAIHRAAGPTVLEQCKRIAAERGGCAPGGAVITDAGKLPAKFIIHTVGPVWRDGKSGEPETLRSAYWNSLVLAASRGARSIAFPSVSTGAYRYPVERAARVALRALRDFAAMETQLEEIRMVLFSETDLDTYSKIWAEVESHAPE